MEELIDKIIENFNFEKVHKVMQTLNWGWMRSDVEVPSVGQLVLCAKELLQDVSKKNVGTSISTGGFKATKIDSKDMGEGLELEFILTSEVFHEEWLNEEEGRIK